METILRLDTLAKRERKLHVEDNLATYCFVSIFHRAVNMDLVLCGFLLHNMKEFGVDEGKCRIWRRRKHPIKSTCSKNPGRISGRL